jgi:adenylate cyclase
MPKGVQRIVAGLSAGVVAAAIVLLTDRLFARADGGTAVNPLQTLEMQTYDWRLLRTAQPSSARQDIALVEIDEFSLKNLQPYFGRWPWPRATHAILLDYLSRARPRVVVYDVMFADPHTNTSIQFGETTISGAESDRKLVEAVKAAGNVVLLVDATYESESAVPDGALALPDAGYQLDVPGITERRAVFPPFPALRDVASGFGHNLFVLDPDGPLRHMTMFVRSNHRVVPSLGVAAALRAGGLRADQVLLDGDDLVMGDRRIRLTERAVRNQDGNITVYKWAAINFRGPAILEDLKSRPYPSYTFWDLFRSEDQLLRAEKPAVDPEVFRDKIVFVGATGAALYDTFETPFAGSQGFKMPGIQVHAAVADDILSNRFIRPAGTLVRIATVGAAAVSVGLVAALVPAWWASAVTLLFVAALAYVSTRLFAGGLWLNLSQPVLAATAALFGGVAYQYFVEGREKRKMKKLFGQYVSKDVYEHLVAHPALARLGGARRDMTVLFSDIRGFTTVSEQGEPEAIVHTLNEYFTRMVDLVFKHRGTLDKFVGDMVMALFGAPLDDPDHADHAVETALEMLEALGRLNERWRAEGRPELEIGIGINTGPMIAGNIGSEAIMNYTVIGDAVNLGSRLESLNKQYGTRIIISEGTRARLKGQYTLRPLGDVVVKGRTKPVAIFEVVGRTDRSTASGAGQVPPRDSGHDSTKEAQV